MFCLHLTLLSPTPSDSENTFKWLYFRRVCGNARCTSRFPSAVYIPVSITKKICPYRGLVRPLGFREVEAPRFPDNWHVKALRLSVLRTGRFYLTESIPLCVLYGTWSFSGPTIQSHTPRPVRCVGLTTLPPSCAVVKKSGNPNFLEPSGPLQACKANALPFTPSQ
jgi:hypothetical protein